MKKILAIDYGLKRVGIAVSRGTLAEPLVVLENDADLFNKLTVVIRDEKIERIVIGISEGEMADLTREFAQDLEEAVGEIPIEFADETLSSKEVEERLKQKGIKHSTRTGGPIDHFAAALILEGWLEVNPVF